MEEHDVSKGILDQTRNDGKVLSDTVSVLTLLFLPGTFVSVSSPCIDLLTMLTPRR